MTQVESSPGSLRPPESVSPPLRNKDIISIRQFDRKTLEKFLSGVVEMEGLLQEKDRGILHLLSGVHLTLLFYEPSTRTMASFDAAAKRLGASTTVITDPKSFSSQAKGETFADSIRIYSGYSDGIILRHPDVGSAQVAAQSSDKPVINAGDGQGEHPTQALLDLYTIMKYSGSLDNLNVAFVGDNKNGRTVHSALDALSLFDGNFVYLISPRELMLPEESVSEYQSRGLRIIQSDSPHIIPAESLDVAYWTRVQKERFKDADEYERIKNNGFEKYVASKEFLDTFGNERVTLMHPLPRVGEIPESLDSDPRSIYFQQAENGIPVRMELLRQVFTSA